MPHLSSELDRISHEKFRRTSFAFALFVSSIPLAVPVIVNSAIGSTRLLPALLFSSIAIVMQSVSLFFMIRARIKHEMDTAKAMLLYS